ncbi:SIMPL domain-containing protein [Pseudonocardia sichuanensis]
MPRATPAALLLAAAALALAGCSGAAAAPPGAPEAPGITARGTGVATATPDTATVVLGVETRDANAAAALAANSERAAAVIGVLEGAGVASGDIRTSRLAILPTRSPESDRITGYEVTNQVTATLHDVAAAGTVIDAAAAAAGDAVRVQDIGFSVADETAAKAAARADAVRQAVAQAEQLAEAAGVALGPIRSVVELPGAQPVPYRAEAADARQAVPVEPGTQELSVAVEVVHGIA